MALIQSTAIPSGATDFELEQSLRFNDDDTAYLSKTPASAGNQKTWTFSCWVKKTFATNTQPIIHSSPSGNPFFTFGFFSHDSGNADKCYLYYYDGSTDYGYTSTRLFRDYSAWLHIVLAVDTTQGTESNRVKVYINGIEETMVATYGAFPQNLDTYYNNNNIQYIGFTTNATKYFDGYLSEVHSIDGAAKTPADFAETGTYGEWKPIEYSGTYGTNGFYLPFKQDYTVEGFSTVTYKGTGANQYIGGTGFNPDLTWIKMRDGTDEHRIMDSVRGIPFSSKTTATAEDNDETTGFTSRSTDGFSVGSAGSYNNSSNKFVAWNWDMGADTPTGFSAVLYRGNASQLDVSGFGFSPDMVWIKPTTTGDHHRLCDTVRGVKKSLTVNETTAESTSSNNFLEAFNPDGFTIDTADGGWNSASHYYIAWGWDMGNTTATNTSGSISSQVRANTTYGQSIVSYTGTGSAATVGHGLSSAPEMVIVKSRVDAYNWGVWHTGLTSADYALQLNNTIAQSNTWDYWNDTAPSSSVFSVGTELGSNKSSSAFIAYCFHSVTGYSKFGSYSGTGSANNAITLGFRPAFLMVKRTNSTEDWFIFDSTRNPLNTVNLRLKANTADADGAYSYVNFTDTGFSWQATGTGQNGSGDSYIYMAFAGGMDSISDYNDTGSSDSRVKASTTYGQSIVSYTGQSGAQTIGHGLSSAPEVVIVKNRSDADEWLMYHHSLTDAKDKYLRLDSAGAVADNTFWNDTAPTSSVFSVGDNRPTNSGHGSSYIAYCWHSVSGYSSIGSFIGNGDSRSTAITINCGFKPAFILMKVADASSNRDWYIWDDTRSNPPSKHLRPNISNAEAGEAGKIEFTSTGVSITTNDDELNANGKKTIYMVFADKREYAYWLDQSGNNNDWTSNNLTESDISVDSPTNNFATLNPLDSNSNITLAEGNLKAAYTSSTWYSSRGTFSPTSGKWYFETVMPSYWAYLHIGVLRNSYNVATNNAFTDAGSWTYQSDGRTYNEDNEVTTNVPAAGSGDVMQVAYDVDAGKIWFGINNTWILSGNPTTAANPVFTGITSEGDISPHILVYGSPATGVVANFGQDSSFAGNKTAQGNQDGNDIGDFYYTPPTGFLALCTKNLPDVAVVPSEHFNTILYTGDDQTGKSITGVGFSPSFIWFKERNNTAHHVLHDAVRGASGGRLSSNRTNAEDASTSIASFDSDGFTVGSSAAYINSNNANIVAWNWKANGSGSSNTNGSINSTVSANVDAGFSIVGWTGNETVSTIGHGLSKAPELLIIKNRDRSSNFVTLSTTGTDSVGYLNLTNAFGTGNLPYFFGNSGGGVYTAPTSSVFTIGGSGETQVNANGEDLIAYCFHSVDGYSAVGSYIGNGNADGTFVYTGFRPAFVIIKPSSRSGHWFIANNKSSPSNVVDKVILANDSAAEYTDPSADCKKDFFSNGFKIRTTDDNTNESGSTYIYIAFAETPFKYSNAR